MDKIFIALTVITVIGMLILALYVFIDHLNQDDQFKKF